VGTKFKKYSKPRRKLSQALKLETILRINNSQPETNTHLAAPVNSFNHHPKLIFPGFLLKTLMHRPFRVVLFGW
jgi:hypothetical protein